jgi:hypothetical protein
MNRFFCNIGEIDLAEIQEKHDVRMTAVYVQGNLSELSIIVGTYRGYFWRNARIHNPKASACQQRRVSMAVAPCLIWLSRVGGFRMFGALQITNNIRYVRPMIISVV